MRLRLAVLLLILVAACSPADRRELARTAFRSGLDRASPGARELLQQGFPQEYVHLENGAIDRAIAGMPTETNRGQASQEFLSIMQSHIGDVVHAPTADLRTTVRTYVSLLQALQTDNVRNCAAIANGGSVPISAGSGTPLFQASSENNVANLRAIVHGRLTPVEHASLSQQDQQRLIDAFERQAGPWRGYGPAPPTPTAAATKSS